MFRYSLCAAKAVDLAMPHCPVHGFHKGALRADSDIRIPCIFTEMVYSLQLYSTDSDVI
jgi:hypothetical protein